MPDDIKVLNEFDLDMFYSPIIDLPCHVKLGVFLPIL